MLRGGLFGLSCMGPVRALYIEMNVFFCNFSVLLGLNVHTMIILDGVLLLKNKTA